VTCQANINSLPGQGGSGAFLLLIERQGFARPHPKSYLDKAWSRQLPRHPGAFHHP